MMGSGDMAIAPLVTLGPVGITSTVMTTWLLTAVIAVLAWSFTRRLRMEPGPLQTAVEGIVGLIESAVSEVAGEHTRKILPFIGSLWIFLVTANLAGLGDGGEGYTSFSIASPTGEGLTRPRSFSRERRMAVAGGLRIV
mgnify:CR=1 FL=1